MKIVGYWILLATAATMQAQTLTPQDPNFQAASMLVQNGMGWYQDSATKAWRVADWAAGQPPTAKTGVGAKCMVDLKKLSAAGVPDTASIAMDHDTPEFKQGVHTIAEIRASCEHLQRVAFVGHFERWAVLAMLDAARVNAGRTDSSFFRNCQQSYEAITKAGIPPTERVPERVIAGTPWNGTIEEIRAKWCDSGMAKAQGNTAAREEPFRKELKADKLNLAIKYGSFFLPGGAGTSDAHALAQASVWFLDLSPSRLCANGLQVHTVRRYQFGPAQQLTATTEKDYCGAPPRAAFQ